MKRLITILRRVGQVLEFVAMLAGAMVVIAAVALALMVGC